MRYLEYREILRADKECWKEGWWNILFFKPGYKVIRNKRRCDFLQDKKLLFPFYVIARLRYRGICVKYGIDIPSHVKIGKGFAIYHFGGIVINKDAVRTKY